MEECIEGTKKLIEYQVKFNEVCNTGVAFSEFQKVYSWTNEYIRAYLELVDLSDKSRALTVMASGDHAFNLVTEGIYDIDTFDTNKLTEYYSLGFKRAMILKYDYYTFIEKMSLLSDSNTSIEIISELVLDLLPYMEVKQAIYWKSILDFNFKIQRRYSTNINLFRMLSFCNNIEDIKIYNNFLTDEKHYELLRGRLGQANIRFKWANAVELAREFSGKYDLILLSNILDYFSNRWKMEWNYEALQAYERELESITSLNGVIFLKYIVNYGISDKLTRCSTIGSSFVTVKDLIDEEVYKLPSRPNKKVFDGMILKRVK